jgi:hypothetical protein
VSHNDPSNVLTAERHECLRLVAARALRDRHGAPWVPHPTRLRWLVDHGLLAITPPPPGSTPDQRRAARVVTPLGMLVLELWGQWVRTPHGSGLAIGVEFAPEPIVVVRAGRAPWRAPIESVMLDVEQEGARP